jgi:hypothetical protein
MIARLVRGMYKINQWLNKGCGPTVLIAILSRAQNILTFDLISAHSCSGCMLNLAILSELVGECKPCRYPCERDKHSTRSEVTAKIKSPEVRKVPTAQINVHVLQVVESIVEVFERGLGTSYSS